MRAGIDQVVAGKEMAVADLKLDIPGQVIVGREIDLLAGEIARADRAHIAAIRRPGAQSGNTVGPIPEVVRIGQPEGVIIDLEAELPGWLQIKLEARVMEVAPAELIHEPVFL